MVFKMACPSVFFIHHPRTGGSHLRSLLRGSGVHFYGGHLSDVSYGLGLGIVTVTILRNPIERVISYLRFVRDRDGSNLRRGMFQEAGWRDFWACDGPEMSNSMTKRISEIADNGDKALRVAKERLHEITVVGFTEQYDAMLDRIFLATGVTLTEGAYSRNESQAIKGFEFNESMIAEIRERNALDIELYDYAKLEGLDQKMNSPCCSAKSKIFGGAVGLAKALSGVGRADNKVIVKRRNICRSCDHAIPCVGNIGRICRCKACGCILKAKTAIESESCPIGKW